MEKIKITIYLPRELLEQIQTRAEEQKRSVTSQIEYELSAFNKLSLFNTKISEVLK